MSHEMLSDILKLIFFLIRNVNFIRSISPFSIRSLDINGLVKNGEGGVWVKLAVAAPPWLPTGELKVIIRDLILKTFFYHKIL